MVNRDKHKNRKIAATEHWHRVPLLWQCVLQCCSLLWYFILLLFSVLSVFFDTLTLLWLTEASRRTTRPATTGKVKITTAKITKSRNYKPLPYPVSWAIFPFLRCRFAIGRLIITIKPSIHHRWIQTKSWSSSLAKHQQAQRRPLVWNGDAWYILCDFVWVHLLW